jgi:hypothetical protein
MPPSATSPSGSGASALVAERAPRPRLSLAAPLSILSSLLVGLVLLLAPWTALWETNWLVRPASLLGQVLLSGFTRGAVSGLGLVNLLVAIADLHGRLAAMARRG